MRNTGDAVPFVRNTGEATILITKKTITGLVFHEEYRRHSQQEQLRFVRNTGDAEPFVRNTGEATISRNKECAS